MSKRTRLGGALGAVVLTFGIAGIALAGNMDVGGGARYALAAESCGIVPLDVELIIDASGSMGSNSSNGKTRMEWAKLSAKQLVASLDANGGVGGAGAHHVGVSWFKGTSAGTALALGASDVTDVNGAINGLSALGNTPLQEGMAAGAGDMAANGRVGAKHILILLSDGRPNPDQGPNGTWASNASGQRPTSGEGNDYLGAADVAISVALGTGGSGASAIDLGLMALIGPDGAYHVVNGDELPDVFANIYEQIACPPPHLVAAKSVDKESAAPGDTLNYTISVSNDGGSDATGVEVHDDISSLLAYGTFGDCDNSCANDADSVDWSDLSIPNGGSIDLHFSIDLNVDGWADGTTELPNTVVVAESNCSADGQDPDCSVLTTVTVESDVSETTTSQETTTSEETTTSQETTTSEETTTFESSVDSTTTAVESTITQPPTDTLEHGAGHQSSGLWLLLAALGALAGSALVLAPARVKKEE